MNLQLMSPIGQTGYGYAGLNLLLQLASDDNSIGLNIMGNPNVESDEQMSIINRCVNYMDLIPYDATCLKIWHQFDLLNRIGNGKYFAFPFFEIDSFNTKEIHHLNFPDELIVSCQWAKDILIKNNIKKPINIVPLGVDRSIFDDKIQNQTNNYVFLTIGKWEKRKSHDIIIECFNKAFTEKDNVELWMVTQNPFLNKSQENAWLNLVQSSKLRNKIKLFPRLPDHKAIAEIISYSNCGIYISRGEGWNLELLETLSMNKPVIVSNYSAHKEYCDQNNSFLIDIVDTEQAFDGIWFFGNGNWAKIDEKTKENIVDSMQYCFKHNIINNAAGVETAKQYSWQNSASELIRCIA